MLRGPGPPATYLRREMKRKATAALATLATSAARSGNRGVVAYPLASRSGVPNDSPDTCFWVNDHDGGLGYLAGTPGLATS